MNIDLWDIERIKPYANNPRHNDDAVDAVAQSIREFGFRQPIVIDTTGIIIVGHTRYKAALKLGLKQVPVHVATDMTPEQARAYRIADNKSADLSDWNYDLLPIELAELQEMNYDLDLLGFDPDELAKLLDPGVKDGLCDPDEVPEPPDEAVTKLGDLWLLGDHRLLCGDAGKPEDVGRLLDGAAIHLVNTDPPYNVKVEPRSNNAVAADLCSPDVAHFRRMARKQKSKPTGKLQAKDRPLTNDEVSEDEFDQMLHSWFSNIARVLLPGRSFYIWGSCAKPDIYLPILNVHGLHFSQLIAWDKQRPVLNRKDFMSCFEILFYGWREGAAHQFFGPVNATDLWRVKKLKPHNMVHLTEKPVELAMYAMQYSSRPGENVLDLFGGSGSTLIAAEQTGRRAFLMELDPLYCDIIVQRFEKFTGKKAEHIPAPEEATA